MAKRACLADRAGTWVNRARLRSGSYRPRGLPGTPLLNHRVAARRPATGAVRAMRTSGGLTGWSGRKETHPRPGSLTGRAHRAGCARRRPFRSTRCGRGSRWCARTTSATRATATCASESGEGEARRSTVGPTVSSSPAKAISCRCLSGPTGASGASRRRSPFPPTIHPTAPWSWPV